MEGKMGNEPPTCERVADPSDCRYEPDAFDP
jgi:hypothetical protein